MKLAPQNTYPSALDDDSNSKLNPAIKSLSILGVTGSVGQATIAVWRECREKFAIESVTAHRNVEELANIAIETGAKRAIIADESLYGALKEKLQHHHIEIAAGAQAVVAAAAVKVDMVLAAMVGAAGLLPALAALQAGNNLALANKECLVSAGNVFLQAVQRHDCRLLPVDSEHSAIFQVLEPHNKEKVERLILTASGGPFRGLARSQLREITPAEAMQHPIWSMGSKISIDSATMMNKALELIEASFLFQMPENKIDVVIHPQSIIHSMVEYVDGSVLAQMGVPDMRIPIAVALAWPERLALSGKRVDWPALARMDFLAVDDERFPALKLARAALKTGGSAPATLNAANEVAVSSFTYGYLPFHQIEQVIEKTMQHVPMVEINDIETVLMVDQHARACAQEIIKLLQQ
ncbi:MAG: 1-deoxy-D-xylulose-5-phosphate reductoisomerase [Alphaproteobacteria bacterium]